jgi:hypothetical protein
MAGLQQPIRGFDVMKPAIFKVKKNTGLNPVARAIAKQRLMGSVMDYRISVFMLDEGDPCYSDAATLDVMVTTMLLAMEDRKDSVECRKLLAAHSVLKALFARDCIWHKADAVTLDNALQIIVTEFPKLPAKAANDAIQRALAAA